MSTPVGIAVTADVRDATLNLAVLRQEAKATAATLKDIAGKTDLGNITQEALAAAEAQAKVTAAIRAQEATMRRASVASKEMGTALGGVQHASAGVTREALVMARELSRANFTRMAGSATILAGRLGILTPAVLGTAGVIAALVAPIVAFIVATEQGAEELGKFQGAMAATNGYAGVTISQLQGMSRELAAFAHEGLGTAVAEMMKLAGTGKFTSQTLLLVGEDSTKMSELTGENADKFSQQFAKMDDGVAKFAQEYQDSYHQLTAAQVEYIRQLEEQGQKETAEYQLAKDVYDYLGSQAPQKLGYLESAWDGVRNAISSAWEELKGFGRDSNQDQIDRLNFQISSLHDQDNKFGANSGTASQIAALEKQKQLVEGREAAEERSAKVRSDAAQTQTAGVDAAAKLSEKFEASKTSGEKLKSAIKDINDELAKAVKADPGHASKYEAEAAAARAQAEKSDTPHEKKGPKGPSDASEWEEQLRAREVASGEFFKDQTADELKFWQDKLALTTAGSKEYLAVQSHIYDASKTLAHQAYEAQLADYNDKLAADKNNWSKEQADWNQKLAFIKGKYGEESTEYRAANREMESAQAEHEAKMLRDTEEAGRGAVETLKKQLDDAKKAREDDARTQQTLIKAKGDSTPFGGVAAAQAEGAIKAQLIQKEMSDLDALQARTDAVNAADVAAAQTAANQDASAYAALVKKKTDADAEFAAQHRTLNAQLRDNSIQTALAMQQAYESYIQSTVSASVQGLDKMISGQENFKQFGISIYQSIVRELEAQITKAAVTWIAKHVLMAAASKLLGASQAAGAPAAAAAMVASSKAQVAALVGLAGAGGVASMAAAPFPLDLEAPEFGQAMAAAAGALGSFAVGTNMVPSDMIAQIHAGERIIPAGDNKAIISALNGGGPANDNRRGGDTHVNYAPTITSARLTPEDLDEHAGHLASMFRQMHRNGVFR